MAEEYYMGICASNLWNPSRTTFGSASCSSLINDIGSFGLINQTFFYEEEMNSNLGYGQEEFSFNMFEPLHQDLPLDQESFNSTNYCSDLLQHSISSDFQLQQSLFHNELASNNYLKNSNDVEVSFTSSMFEEKPNYPKLSTKFQAHDEVDQAVKNINDEPAFKRLRIETPSTLPTFKVRKEKLGDRITALQQLVSPFGKTDTASVLHEAVEYINLLHSEVNVLSNQYTRNGAPIQQQSRNHSQKNTKAADLRSRGLCLVPITSTFPVATETSTDIWTPSFGGAFF